MSRRLLLIVVAALVVAACSGDSSTRPVTTPEHSASSTSIPAPSTTTTAVPTTTSTPVAEPDWPPPYLRYGWDGVWRFDGDIAILLVAEPVSWAADDGAGGVVFRSVADQPGIAWLAAGADRPTPVDVAGRVGVVLAGSLEGRPSLFLHRYGDDLKWCVPGDYVSELVMMDLETERMDFVMCDGVGPDGSVSFGSVGGGLISAVTWAEVSAFSTSTRLIFFDLDGNEITLEHNPFAESCAPCHLSVHLSPDGQFLAYAHWPAAFWSMEEPADGDYGRLREEWWERHREIPTELGLIDLATGAEGWHGQAAAMATVTGFDGRAVTVASAAGRTIHDTDTGSVLEAPPISSDPAAFWTAMVGSYPVEEYGYDDVQPIARTLAERFGATVGVLWSSGYPTLNPGFWAVVTGHFSTLQGASELCRVFGLDAHDCYPRYIADAATVDPDIGRTMLEVRGDGLGVVDFGTPVDDTMAILTGLLGETATDDMPYPGESIFPGTYFRIVTWVDPPLRIMFMDWDGDEVGDVPTFQYFDVGPSDELETAEGIRADSPFADVLAVYGDRVEVYAPDECTSVWTFAVDYERGDGPDFLRGGLDGHPDDPTTRITGLRSGIEMGPC